MTYQLYELSRPFPDNLVKKKPGGKFQADYVDHATVTGRLLEVLGAFDWEITSPITNAEGIVVGCIGTLHAEVDGRPIHISEVGDVEHPGQNSATNLKSASSDALKRCAMRMGVGLHLWAGDGYYLDRSLKKQLDEEDAVYFPTSSPAVSVADDPDAF